MSTEKNPSGREFLKTFIQGRIDSSRQHNGKYYTQITAPAADAYSQPSRFELRSSSPIGSAGTTIEVAVVMTGFIRHFKFTDKATGQIRDGSEVNVFLDVI